MPKTRNLGGHLKTGHTWTLQNRPTERNQNKSIYTLETVIRAIIFSRVSAAQFILALPGRRIWQRRDATRAPTSSRNGGAIRVAPHTNDATGTNAR
jgi:hypothetical protein